MQTVTTTTSLLHCQTAQQTVSFLLILFILYLNIKAKQDTPESRHCLQRCSGCYSHAQTQTCLLTWSFTRHKQQFVVSAAGCLTTIEFIWNRRIFYMIKTSRQQLGGIKYLKMMIKPGWKLIKEMIIFLTFTEVWRSVGQSHAKWVNSRKGSCKLL